ncbi:salicylate hydroxylase [Gymnopilus junonius]|uniref:Salicylate hydroxylase n=1 Tax=Gymnopilus junonius TaxID=109634 RepID=A0A9P5NK06_GYMJU|nr:salicylate hydroxylase [Gymnopilus junonius]
MTGKLRIAIVGAGIGGLTLAVALSHLELEDYVEVTIYESTSELKQVGAGITVWPRGWEILKNMGLEASLTERIAPEQRDAVKKELRRAFVFRKSDQVNGTLISDMHIPGGSISYHRADVQETLLEHISPSIQIHTSHRLTAYRESEDGVELIFKDGKAASCDVLIGADGINSAVRKTFLSAGKGLSEEEATQIARPVWTGTIVYRDLINSDSLRQEAQDHPALTLPMVYCGKNQHIVTYPVLQGRLINTIPFFTEPEKEGTYVEGPVIIENTTDDFVSPFKDWEEEARIILKKPSRWAVQTVNPLETYVSNRVMLMGDAAHAMATHLGNGAGQAIEDAYILSNVIAKSVRQEGLVNIAKIAKIYDTIRQPFGNFAVVASRNQGQLYEFTAPGFEDVKPGEVLPQEKLEELKRAIEKNWWWTYDSARGDLERALAMF